MYVVKARVYTAGMAYQCGEQRHSAKMTAEKVVWLRTYRTEDPERWTYQALGIEFGISSVMAYKIVKHLSWKHVV